MNLLIDIGYYKEEAKRNKKEIIILNDIVEQQKSKTDNLFQQNKICSDSNEINKQQAKEYKHNYLDCAEDLANAKKVPWWKFNLKSVVAGSMGTLILILVL